MNSILSAPVFDPVKPPLLLGGGKLAKHLAHYFHLKSTPYLQWTNARDFSEAFDQVLTEASFVWILVSDRALEPLVKALLKKDPAKIILHSSAALNVENASTLHPLQTFGPELYSLETYEKISFTVITEEWAKIPETVKHWIHSLGNPHVQISAESRVLYHASCSMMANFPQILWNEIFKLIENKLSLSPQAFLPLLQQSFDNYLVHGARALTGPLVRGDTQTLDRHREALASTSLSQIYDDFVQLYTNTPQEKK